MTESYKSFLELARERYSCRDFDAARPVDKDTVEQIIETARLAPSAVNKQPWVFVAVTDLETRQRILAKSRPSFINAPVLIVACGLHDDAWHRPSDNKDHTDVDVSIAIEHICLSAASLGLGTCWVCSFDVPGTCDTLSLPENVEPVALIPLGYPAVNQIPAKKRKEFTEILRWEKF